MADYKSQSAYNTQTGARAADAHLVDEGLRTYMLRVYNYMALGVAFTAIVSLTVINTPALFNAIAGGGFWLLFIGILGMGFFAHKLILTGSTLTAQIAFWAYAALWGGAIAPMIYKYLQANPTLIMQAFAITAVTFGSMSLLGYTTKKDLSPFATFFTMAVIGLIVAMLLNVFIFQSPLFGVIVSFLVVLIFAGITAWETQEIKQSYFAGDDAQTTTGKAIFGAFLLYGSFVTIFIHVLSILGFMGGDD